MDEDRARAIREAGYLMLGIHKDVWEEAGEYAGYAYSLKKPVFLCFCRTCVDEAEKKHVLDSISDENLPLTFVVPFVPNTEAREGYGRIAAARN